MFEDAQRPESDSYGLLYLQQATWEDAPHLTEEAKRKLLAGVPKWQHDMRSKGLPVIGSGAVFPYMDEEITINDVILQDSWHMVAGIDFGKQADPSVICFSAYDPVANKYYIVDEIYLDEDRSPKAIADAIKNSPFPNVWAVLPHDAWGEASETAANQLKHYGVNVFPEPFRNPTETRLGIDVLNKKGSINHKAMIEPGLQTMRFMFDENLLKVSRHCHHWLKEKRAYFYKPNNGIQETTGADHCIDASRYAVMSLLNNRYLTVAQSREQGNNQFNSFKGFNF